MPNKDQVNKKDKWMYKSSEVSKEIERYSDKIWINRCIKYIEKMAKSSKLPTLADFYKQHGIWIYYLRDDIAKGCYAKNDDLQNKYRLIKSIIDDNKKDTIVNKNIDKATFAINYLQQEDNWDKEKALPSQNITFNLANFSLDGEVPLELPTPPTENIIEGEVVEAEVVEYDELVIDDDIPIPQKEKDDDIIDIFAEEE